MRKWLPTVAELIDRLSIHQLKEVFLPEHKEKYSAEMKDLVHDIDLLLEEGDVKVTGEFIRTVVVIAQMNTHIWYNESKARNGESQNLDLLRLTHGLNGIRNRASNYMLNLIGQGDRKDIKTDCLAAGFEDWEVSLGDKNVR
jgi:hypothetical protein